MSSPRPRRTTRLAVAVSLLASGLAWQVVNATSALAAAPTVTRLSDTQLDPSAIFFVSYDGLVNNSYARPFHVYQDTAGAWHKMEVPVALNATGRSQLVLDRFDNAYMVLPFGRIVAASKASGWTDWTVRFDGAGLSAFGEVTVDRSRVASGVLSILYQRTSSGTTPSPIRVVDFQLG